jgi:hypothetical protein
MAHAHRAHQHDAAHGRGPGDGDGQRDRAAHRVTDDVHSACVERVEQGQRVVSPRGAAVGARIAAGRSAEAELVRRDDPPVRAQRRQHRAPVRHRGDAGA